MQSQNEQRVLSHVLKFPDSIKKLQRLNDKFFSKKDDRKVFKLLNSGITSIEEIVENFPERDQKRIEEYLNTRKADSWPVPIERIQQVIDFDHKKSLEKLIIKSIDNEVKTGKYDFKKIWKLRKKIEDLEIKEVELKPLSERTASPVKWLWKNRFPLGTVSLIAGEKESGKSTLCEWIAAHVTTGEDWPDVENNIKGSVIIAQTENDWDRQVVPTLDAFEANRSKILEFDPPENDTIKICDNLRILIRKIGDVHLVIFDPITEYVGSLEGNAEIPVRHALKPFFNLAHEFNLAILFIKHLRKAPAGNILEKIGGSGSWVNVPRAVWIVVKDEKDEREERRKFIKGALNLTRETTDLAFSMFNRNGYPFIAWEEEPLDRNEGKSEFMDPEEKEKLTAKAYAKEFILATLETVEDLNSDDLKETCLKDGISKASYDRAKSELYKQKKVDRFQRGGIWHWKKI